MGIDPVVDHEDVDVAEQLAELGFLAAAPAALLQGNGVSAG